MWARVGSIVVGIWLMGAPSVLGYDDPARAIDRVLGPIAATAAIVALSEVVRPLRWIEIAVGVLLLGAPWAFGYPAVATANSVGCGAALIACGATRGRVVSRIGGGWSAVVRGRSLR